MIIHIINSVLAGVVIYASYLIKEANGDDATLVDITNGRVGGDILLTTICLLLLCNVILDTPASVRELPTSTIAGLALIVIYIVVNTHLIYKHFLEKLINTKVMKDKTPEEIAEVFVSLERDNIGECAIKSVTLEPPIVGMRFTEYVSIKLEDGRVIKYFTDTYGIYSIGHKQNEKRKAMVVISDIGVELMELIAHKLA